MDERNSLLKKHSLKELQQASAELRAHIRARRPKRKFRRFLSTSLGLGFTIFGGYLIVTNLQEGRFIGMFSWFGVAMLVTGLMIIYSDFADD